jgi:hypothetical protein
MKLFTPNAPALFAEQSDKSPDNAKETLPFNDIEVVDTVDTRVNFIIKCEEQSQADILKRIWQVNANKIDFEKLERFLKQ